MALQEKYKALTDAAIAAGISDLAVREQDGIYTLMELQQMVLQKTTFGKFTIKSTRILLQQI
ncbi:hypothetical protein [Pedobacter jamesrossensis]|uniref:Uncharacterized protein n=1 Tax=Pedobacter jamesrossensis TaxID=1908238 RepID=A0ABV8NQR5_9SPHI